MSQQHGLGETLEIQAGKAFGLAQFLVDLVGDNRSVHRCQLDLGWLQLAVGLVAGAALAPEGAVSATLDLELNLGQTVGRVPGHQLVAAGGQRTHPRCAVVQRQADGIEQGGLAGTGGPGNGEQAIVLERLGGEVDLPLTLQRVEILQAQAEDLHGLPSVSWLTTC